MKQEARTINGKEFKLQSIPFFSYMQLTDRHTNQHGVLQRAGYANELIKHCVIEPKVALKDFDDDYETGLLLVAEIESFLQSKKQSATAENE